jgi:hypothetical protein
MKNKEKHQIIIREDNGTEKVCECALLIENVGDAASVTSVGMTNFDAIRFTGTLLYMLDRDELMELFVKTLDSSFKNNLRKALEK